VVHLELEAMAGYQRRNREVAVGKADLVTRTFGDDESPGDAGAPAELDNARETPFQQEGIVGPTAVAAGPGSDGLVEGTVDPAVLAVGGKNIAHLPLLPDIESRMLRLRLRWNDMSGTALDVIGGQAARGSLANRLD
jgi:hypothetical protein